VVEDVEGCLWEPTGISPARVPPLSRAVEPEQCPGAKDEAGHHRQSRNRLFVVVPGSSSAD
jgi:hypothetical protein